MTRWRMAAALAAAAWLVAVYGVSPAAARTTVGEAATATKITVAYANKAANFTPLFVGIREGFFARNGLDVSPFLASGGRGNAILQADDAQFSLDSGEPNITAIARGGDFVMLGATANRFGFKLLARKPIARVQDLVGKKLALSSPTAAVGTAGEALLKQFGLLGRVEIVYIPSIPARLAALEAGNVDAMIASPPVAPLMATGKYNDIYDLRSLRFVLVGVWAKRSYAQANPATARAFLRGLTQAMQFMREPKNKAKTKRYLAEATGFTDAASLEEAYRYELIRYQEEPNVDRRALENSIAVVERTLGRDVDMNGFLHLGPLQRVLTYKASGALDPRQARPRPKSAAGARGFLTATLNPQGQLKWQLTFRGLSGPATRADIHIGAPGKAGPARVRLCTPCRSGQRGTAKAYSALARAIKSGGAYVNVRTKRNPTGEIRGQVRAVLGS